MKRPTPTILIWIIGLILAVGWIAHDFDIHHDLASFLPDRDRPIERILLTKADQGAVSRTVLAGFEGGSLGQREAASRDAAKELRALTGIVEVANGIAVLDLQAFEPLFSYRYLLGETSNFDGITLRTALEARLRELRSPLGSTVKQTLANDPTAIFRMLLLSWTDADQGPELEQGVWVSPDRARTLLLATIDEALLNQGGGEQVVLAIRQTLQEIGARHGVELLLAGRPILVDEARESVRASLVYGSIAASALVIILLLWIYRSFGVLIIGGLPILTGVAMGLFSVLVLYGPVHGIALAFGITLLGITIDYPLHLFSHLRPGESMETAARRIQRPIFLGAVTTAGMFAIFGAGQAPGLGQLACFAAIGILTAALTLRFVIPDLAKLFGIKPLPRPIDILPARAPRALLGLVVIAVTSASALLMLRSDHLFEADIGVLNPLPEASKLLDQRLRQDLGAPDLRHFYLIEADDAETVLQQAEALTVALDQRRQAGEITGFDTPSRYLPSLTRQKDRQDALPEAEPLAAGLTEASAALPFKANLFSPFVQAVDQSRALPLLDGEAGLGLFRQTPLGSKLDQLLLQEGGRWYGFVPLSGLVDKSELQALAGDHDDVVLIDLKSLSEDILSAFREDASLLLLFGFVAIIVMLLAVKYPYRDVAKIAVVLMSAMIVTTALLALVGEKLAMLHILAGLLVVGLGLDYTIFFSWPEADVDQRRRSRHALFICLLSTVIVFGLLAISSIELLRSIGLTVALGACTTFAIAYAFLSRPHDEV